MAQLDHMRVSKGAKGGYVVEHHYAGSVNGSYKAPEMHVFGKKEAPKMLAHIAEHMGAKGMDADGDKD